jgi:hypothetical protein
VPAIGSMTKMGARLKHLFDAGNVFHNFFFYPAKIASVYPRGFLKKPEKSEDMSFFNIKINRDLNL